MPGYFDQYGAGDERRIKIIRTVAISLVSLLVGGGVLFFVFHNYREERQVKQFFASLASHDYKAAYALFGCTDVRPCPQYPAEKFMEDWGPGSGRSDLSNFRISKSRSCGSGVIMTVDFGRNHQDKLWVERQDMSIGFSPFPGCPPGR
jgi:hypothetical protein